MILQRDLEVYLVMDVGQVLGRDLTEGRGEAFLRTTICGYVLRVTLFFPRLPQDGNGNGNTGA